MRQLLANALHGIAGWIEPKSMPGVLAGQQWAGTNYIDAYKRNRTPTANELMAELKNTAWACASVNAAVCANNPPALYVATDDDQPAAKCRTKALSPRAERHLRSSQHLAVRHRKAAEIHEVIDHPLLELLQQVNPVMNGFDLWELTTLYQEVHGAAYWLLDIGPLGVPTAIWVLPTQNVTPTRKPDSSNVVDFYRYRTGSQQKDFTPDQIIHFRYPDPRDPYSSGLAPLRACYEQVALASDYAAMKKAIYENKARPDVIVAPDEVIGEEERDRMEQQWNAKFRRGGSGRALFTESPMKVSLLSASMGDLAQLAEVQANKEDICCAFHVPVAYFTTNTNMANIQAAQQQHTSLAIHPRLTRRDQKLNEQLMPLYDPSGRLFLASEDPRPQDPQLIWQQTKNNLMYGVTTINDERASQGFPPVPWGDEPWLPLNWAPISTTRGAGNDPTQGSNNVEDPDN